MHPSTHGLYHFEGREWHCRSIGCQYQTVRIYAVNRETQALELAEVLGPFRGTGNYYLQVALAHLKMPTNQGTTLYVRETLRSTYSLADVSRKCDL